MCKIGTIRCQVCGVKIWMLLLCLVNIHWHLGRKGKQLRSGGTLKSRWLFFFLRQRCQSSLPQPPTQSFPSPVVTCKSFPCKFYPKTKACGIAGLHKVLSDYDGDGRVRSGGVTKPKESLACGWTKEHPAVVIVLRPPPKKRKKSAPADNWNKLA